jgi:hypothetical protein
MAGFACLWHPPFSLPLGRSCFDELWKDLGVARRSYLVGHSAVSQPALVTLALGCNVCVALRLQRVVLPKLPGASVQSLGRASRRPSNQQSAPI